MQQLKNSTTSSKSTKPRQSLITKIHIAKSELKLNETDYKNILFNATGKYTCKDLTFYELAVVMDRFKKLGFKVKPKIVKNPKPKKPIGLLLHYWSVLGKKGVIKNYTSYGLALWVSKTFSINFKGKNQNDAIVFLNSLSNRLITKSKNGLLEIATRNKITF